MAIDQSSRTLVNLIGIPSLLFIIIVGDTFYNLPIFSFFIVVVLFLGTKEITNLSVGKEGKPVILLLLFFLAILQMDRHPVIHWDIPIYQLILGMTLIAMVFEIFRGEQNPLLNISILVFSFVWLGIMLGSLSNLRNLPGIGFKITFALFLSVWICDTSAFFFGKNFGEKKILPDISPNKTWVGTIAGFLSSIIFMLILDQYDFFNGMVSTADVIVIGIIVGGFGQLGDWAESLLKREAGIKDTSNYLLGHGGILDRFDSLTFTSPLTLIYCNYFIIVGR